MNLKRTTAIARTTLLLFALLFIAASCSLLGGKSTKPVAWNIKITKSTPASIEVDLIGVSPSEDGYWRRSVKPDDYWDPNKPIRKQAATRMKSTRFEEGPTFVLKSEDPIWNKWLSYGATELLIMASLKNKHSNDESDPRRLFISITKGAWQAKDKTLEVEILEDQIRVLNRENL
jgi:hypothetical protein